jgi:hypothetical protein
MDMYNNTIYNKGCGFNYKFLQTLSDREVVDVCNTYFGYGRRIYSDMDPSSEYYKLKMVIPSIVLYGLSYSCVKNTSSLKTLCKLGKYGLIDLKKKLMNIYVKICVMIINL